MAFPQDHMDMPRSNEDTIQQKQMIGVVFETVPGSHRLINSFDSDEDARQCTKNLESCKDRYRSFTMNANLFGDGPKLWNNFAAKIVGQCTTNRSFESELDFFDWCSETVHSFDRYGKACQRTKWGGCCTTCYAKQWLKDFPTAVMCLHNERWFLLTAETLARCIHVANVISVSCFLFCLRIGTFEGSDGSVIDKSRLMDNLSTVLDKWKWGGDECRNTFNDWIDYVTQDQVASEKEEAMELLYQWTLDPVDSVLDCVSLEFLGASRQNYVEVDRVSKWGDELCQFLEDKYWILFKVSDEVEFLYYTMIDFHSRTADFHDTLANHTGATELRRRLKTMLEDVQENNLKVPQRGKFKIEYQKPKYTYSHMSSLSYLLGDVHFCENCLNEQDSYKICRIMSQSESSVHGRELYHGLDNVETHEKDHIESPFDPPFGRQLQDIVYLTEQNRYSEAREILMQVDLKSSSDRANLRKFLEFLNGPEVAKFSVHSSTIAPETLELLCERQDLVLDGSEALLGDRQLTGKFLQQYARMIGIRSDQNMEKFLVQVGEDKPGEDLTGSSLRRAVHLWLTEELNLLELTLPEQYIQRVISCLRDPCETGEHKRKNLSDTLKTYRLWKSSIDIFSELLHNWSYEGTASEVEWLRLLESQKNLHNSILGFLFAMLGRCKILERNNSSVGADNGQKDVVGSNHSNFLVYRALNQAFCTSTLVWAERGRARTLLTQLGPWYNMRYVDGNAGSLKEELIEFDKDEEAAWNSIQWATSACKTKTLFIEYVMRIPAGNSLSSSKTYSDGTTPKAYITDERRRSSIIGLDLFNGSCEADGRFDEQVEGLLKKFYEMVGEFCNTQPLPRRLEDGVVADLHRILEKLYDLLIEPIFEFKQMLFTQLDPLANATIVFVPDKILYRVPFALLRDKKTQKYLFQRHPIAISPSLRVLQHCERQLRELEKSPLKADGCILAVGNAAYEKNLLPGTEKELDNLYSCFPGRVKTLEQEEATRAKVLELVHEASRSEEEHAFAFIHLAVHGHWSKIDSGEDNPYKTGSLQFAKLPVHSERSGVGPTTDLSNGFDGRTPQSRTEELDEDELKSSGFREIRHVRAFGEVGAVTRGPDGYRSSAAGDMLSSEDIINGGIQWRTRLVVLSACNSLRGQTYSDGEVNLPRALMIAGVPAAVVSQWKVSDVGSPRLMKAFYEHLQRGQDIATALQSAMLQLFNDPDSESANNIFEWGPFLVWGLPHVRLPKEMLISENARKALPALQQAESLRWAYNNCGGPEDKVELLLNLLKAVSNVFEAVYSESTLEDDAIVDAFIAVYKLLFLSRDIYASIDIEFFSSDRLLRDSRYFYEEHIQLAEEFFKLLPFERLEKVEIRLNNRVAKSGAVYDFKDNIMFTQAMQGNYLIALHYAEKMRMCEKHGANLHLPQIWWVNRAVVWRLMGKYEEALESFNRVLEHGGDSYECLIQTSYLKYLMKDKSGALEYALRAKKYEVPEVRKPGYGTLTLSYRALPNEYREWLLNVVDSAGASSSSIWDSLTSQIPKEPTRTTRNANQQIERLRLKFTRWEINDTEKFGMLKALTIVENFLASAYNKCVLVQEVIVSAVSAVEQVLSHPHVSEEVIALGEEFYSVYLYEQATRIGLESEKKFPRFFMRFIFRLRLMYTLAMKESYPIALEYANEMTEDILQNAEKWDGAVEWWENGWSNVVRQERAVILRLVDKYDEALKEFEELLTQAGDDYECLIQTSYLKHLMQDGKGALEYALRAKTFDDSHPGEKDRPGYGAFTLGFKALPDEYRRWLSNVDPESQGHAALLSSLTNVPTPRGGEYSNCENDSTGRTGEYNNSENDSTGRTGEYSTCENDSTGWTGEYSNCENDSTGRKAK